MNIPDKAVGSARKALLAEARKVLGARGDISTEGARFMKITLDAAAPYLAAQALRDASEHMADETDAAWLRSFADELDGNGAP